MSTSVSTGVSTGVSMGATRRQLRILRRRPARPGEAGGSLVELSLAMAVTAVLVGSIMHMCVQNARTRKGDSELRLALSACENVLEEARSLPLSELPALNGKGFDVPGTNGGPKGLAPVAGSPTGLAGSISTKIVAQVSDYILYRVTARVDWWGVQGERSFELKTLVTRR